MCVFFFLIMVVHCFFPSSSSSSCFFLFFLLVVVVCVLGFFVVVIAAEVEEEIIKAGFPSLLIDLMKRPKDADFILKCTLPGTNISRIKALLKMTFLFARWDMLVPKVHF